MARHFTVHHMDVTIKGVLTQCDAVSWMFHPGCPPQTAGPPSAWHPGEADEVEDIVLTYHEENPLDPEAIDYDATLVMPFATDVLTDEELNDLTEKLIQRSWELSHPDDYEEL